MLYEVALVEMPTKEETEKGVSPKILLQPKCVIAADENSAGIAAVMDNKDDLPENFDMSKVKVFVRPFIGGMSK